MTLDMIKLKETEAIDRIMDKLHPIVVYDAITGERKTYVRHKEVRDMLKSLIEDESETIHCHECRYNLRPERSPNVDCALYYQNYRRNTPCFSYGDVAAFWFETKTIVLDNVL